MQKGMAPQPQAVAEVLEICQWQGFSPEKPGVENSGQGLNSKPEHQSLEETLT